jgi:hypothetical protein
MFVMFCALLTSAIAVAGVPEYAKIVVPFVLDPLVNVGANEELIPA